MRIYNYETGYTQDDTPDIVEYNMMGEVDFDNLLERLEA